VPHLVLQNLQRHRPCMAHVACMAHTAPSVATSVVSGRLGCRGAAHHLPESSGTKTWRGAEVGYVGPPQVAELV